MDDKDLELFNRRAIRTKKELLYAVDKYIDRLQQDEGIEIVRRGRSKPLAELMLEFRGKIEITPLADLEKPFCAYEVDIVDTEIELYINEYSEIAFDNNGEMEKSRSSITPGIIVTTAPYIPINKFADMQGVKAGTVRQWIRRGKIRNVKKIGSEWLIASTEGKPDRGFNDGTYYCIDEDGDMSKLFPLKEGTHSIWLWKEDPYSEECFATMRDNQERKIDEIKLNRTAREKLEHALAAAEEVKFQSTFIDAITDKVFEPDSADRLNARDFVIGFLETVDLQEKYKTILKAIASANDIDGACTAVIDAFGLTLQFEGYLKSESEINYAATRLS